MILGGWFDHDHVEEEDRTIERQALRQACKQKVVAEPCERPNKLIARSVNRCSSADDSTVSSILSGLETRSLGLNTLGTT